MDRYYYRIFCGTIEIIDRKPNMKNVPNRVIRKYKDMRAAKKFLRRANANIQ